MKKKKENVKLIFELILLSIGLIFIIAYLSKFFFYVDGYFQFNEWATSIIGLIGALIGGIFTMLGVIYTLNSNISDKESEKNEKIKNLKFILKYEIECFFDSFKDEILNYTEKEFRYLEEYLEGWIDTYEDSTLKFENIYKIDLRFKEYMYELILLDESNGYKDELIGFFRSYSIILEKGLKQDKILIELGESIRTLFDCKFNYIIDIIEEYESKDDNLYELSNFFVAEKEIINQNISLFKNNKEIESKSPELVYLLNQLS